MVWTMFTFCLFRCDYKRTCFYLDPSDVIWCWYPVRFWIVNRKPRRPNCSSYASSYQLQYVVTASGQLLASWGCFSVFHNVGFQLMWPLWLVCGLWAGREQERMQGDQLAGCCLSAGERCDCLALRMEVGLNVSRNHILSKNLNSDLLGLRHKTTWGNTTCSSTLSHHGMMRRRKS